jgi:hypothetical protein
MQLRTILLILILVPLPVSLWAVGKDLWDSMLVNVYEVRDSLQTADFDSDGLPGEILFEPNSDEPKGNGEWPRTAAFVVIRDHGQEVMRFPYRHLDGTRRTHVAVNSTTQPTRVLIYDRLGGAYPPPNGVFAWNGQAMGQVPPAALDEEILDAMAATDDTGTWNLWAGLRLVHLLSFFGYYLPLVILRWRLKPAKQVSASVV